MSVSATLAPSRPSLAVLLLAGGAVATAGCAPQPASHQLLGPVPAAVVAAPSAPQAAPPAILPVTQVNLAKPEPAPRPSPPPPLPGHSHLLEGVASFYWQAQMTASGEVFDRNGFTAAHRTLPFGTRVKVTSLASGRSVVVRINDRGPFKPTRVIDLSEAAAKEIGMTAAGLARVRIEPLTTLR